ncbi:MULTISPECIES: cystatin domain-containing protein [Burkholderia]|uniref:cystatin domain-containing protein n=1 Tax=Burkholderia cepacia TaxID=292 RepID=UPI0012BD165D
MGIPGGLSDMSLDASTVSEIRNVIDSVRSDIAQSLNAKLTDYEVTAARQQIVAGVNYTVSFSSGGKSYRATIYVPTPGSGQPNKLTSAEEV